MYPFCKPLRESFSKASEDDFGGFEKYPDLSLKKRTSRAQLLQPDNTASPPFAALPVHVRE